MNKRNYRTMRAPAARRLATGSATPATATPATAGRSARTSARAPASAPPRTLSWARLNSAAHKKRTRSPAPSASSASASSQGGAEQGQRPARRQLHAESGRHPLKQRHDLRAAFGVTSMVAPLQRVLVRKPATSGDWDGAGWLHARRREPRAPARAGSSSSCSTAWAWRSSSPTRSSTRSTSTMHDFRRSPAARARIPLNMAKAVRKGEPAHAKVEFERLRSPHPRHARGRRLPGRRRPLLPRRHHGRHRPRLPDQPARRPGAAGAAGPGGHPRRGLRHAARPGPGLRPAPAVVPPPPRPRTCSSSTSRSPPSACSRT